MIGRVLRRIAAAASWSRSRSARARGIVQTRGSNSAAG
jgi:hypothetical protein